MEPWADLQLKLERAAVAWSRGVACANVGCADLLVSDDWLAVHVPTISMLSSGGTTYYTEGYMSIVYCPPSRFFRDSLEGAVPLILGGVESEDPLPCGVLVSRYAEASPRPPVPRGTSNLYPAIGSHTQVRIWGGSCEVRPEELVHHGVPGPRDR